MMMSVMSQLWIPFFFSILHESQQRHSCIHCQHLKTITSLFRSNFLLKSKFQPTSVPAHKRALWIFQNIHPVHKWASMSVLRVTAEGKPYHPQHGTHLTLQWKSEPSPVLTLIVVMPDAHSKWRTWEWLAKKVTHIQTFSLFSWDTCLH